jgi:hypothetical protein
MTERCQQCERLLHECEHPYMVGHDAPNFQAEQVIVTAKEELEKEIESLKGQIEFLHRTIGAWRSDFSRQKGQTDRWFREADNYLNHYKEAEKERLLWRYRAKGLYDAIISKDEKMIAFAIEIYEDDK